ncbi:MAG TPA: toprim domain-containing protein [Candidatus Thermoplasmatota archaeon]|nr:toprim domain-containing protein [Candidatus Thermoplasmatota archaeon]
MTTEGADTEALEALEEWLEAAIEATAATLTLVEGEKDIAALRALGFTGPLRQVQTAGGLFGLAETLREEGVKEAIILTDWDRTGGKVARLLEEALRANGIRADLEVRRKLVRAAREIRHVESLDTYLETVRARAAAPARAGPEPRRE